MSIKVVIVPDNPFPTSYNISLFNVDEPDKIISSALVKVKIEYRFFFEDLSKAGFFIFFVIYHFVTYKNKKKLISLT